MKLRLNQCRLGLKSFKLLRKIQNFFYTFTAILYLLFPSGWWFHILCRRQDISTFYLRASEITWNIFWLDNSLMTTHRIWDLDFSWGCIVWKYCHWTLRNILAALKSVEKSDFNTSPCTSQNIDPWDNSMIVNSFLGGDVKNGTNKIGSMGVLALVRHLQTYFTIHVSLSQVLVNSEHCVIQTLSSTINGNTFVIHLPILHRCRHSLSRLLNVKCKK